MKNEMINDSNLDKLFHSARNQAPLYSFSETQAVFSSAAIVGVGSAVGLKILGSSLFKTKFFIMTVTAIALLSSILLVNYTDGTTDDKSTNDLFKSENVDQIVNGNKLLLTNASNLPVHSKDTRIPSKTSSAVGILAKIPTLVISSSPFLNNYFDNNFLFLSQKLVIEDTILISHIITEKTTEEELNAIQKQAAEAGIEMNYNTVIRRKIIRRLNIELNLMDNKKISQSVRIAPMSFNKEFSLPLAWRTDREGKVIDFAQVYPQGAYVTVYKKNDYKAKKLSKKRKEIETDSVETLNINAEAVDLRLQPTNMELALRDDVPTDIMLNRNIIQNFNTVNHVLNVNTTEAQLDEIQKEALAAKMVFKYTVSYKKDKIKNIFIEMIIRSDDGNLRNDVRINRKKGESFSVPLIWRTDEFGNAVDFGNPNQMKYLGGL